MPTVFIHLINDKSWHVREIRQEEREGYTKQHTLNETLDRILYNATGISEDEM